MTDSRRSPASDIAPAQVSIPVQPSNVNAAVAAAQAVRHSGGEGRRAVVPDISSWAQESFRDADEAESVEGDDDFYKVSQDDINSFAETEPETEALLVLQFSSAGNSVMRPDLSRVGLLAECRRCVEEGLKKARVRKGSQSLSNVVGAAGASGSLRSASQRKAATGIQLRDLRRLVGRQEHSILPRRGALVISMGQLNALVTHSDAYVVIPDGTDKLLEPLLARLNRGPKASSEEMPFEFRVLEATLLTLITHFAEGVQQCLRDKQQISKGVQSSVSSEMLTKTWKLKRRMTAIVEDIQGAERAIQEVQEDEEDLALMYVSALQEDPDAYDELLRSNRGNTEHVQLLMDAYALEFHALASQILLVQKEIDATEDLLRLQLDVARNNLWKVDILVGMASMWIALAAMVAGLWGMNVHVGWEDQTASPYDGTPFRDCNDCSQGNGPSWAWFNVTVGSGVGALVLILCTTCWLWYSGYLRS